MKKITLTIICAALCTYSIFAQNRYNAIFYSENGERFWVILNGVRQNENAETNVKVSGLNAPNYSAKIIFKDKPLGEIDKTLMMPEASSEVTFRIKKNNKGEYVLRYFSAVPLPITPSASPSQTLVMYSSQQQYPQDPWGPGVTTTTTTTTNTSPAKGENLNMNISISEGSVGVNMNVNDGTQTHSTGSTSTTTTVTTSSTAINNTAQPHTDHYIMQGYSGPMGCPWPMEPSDFNEAKGTISSKSFEDSKLQIAKQIVGSNCLFADQVRDIMKLFGFEDSRLEFAKYAYNRTYDQGNYFKVNNAFDFETSIDDLNEYIKAQ